MVLEHVPAEREEEERGEEVEAWAVRLPRFESRDAPERDVVVVDHHALFEALVGAVLRVDLRQQRFDFHNVVHL